MPCSSPRSRFGSNQGFQPSANGIPTEGLPLYLSPSAGQFLSHAQMAKRSELGRREYAEATKRRVVSRVFELAHRLLPVVVLEVGGFGNDRAGPESTGLSNKHDGMGEIDVNCQLDAPNDSKVDDEEYMPADEIGVHVDPDVALMDIEADALLESIRNDSFIIPEEKRKSQRKENATLDNDRQQDDDDSVSITSYASEDDDDVALEMSQLTNIIEILQQDLQEAGEHPFTHQDVTSQRTSRKFWKSLGFGKNSNDDSSSLIYGGVALIWAAAILLSGHSTLHSIIREQVGLE